MQRAIRWFNEFRLLLWVCRVSVTSVVLGWILLHALLVAITLLVFWAFPVFYAARKALDDPH